MLTYYHKQKQYATRNKICLIFSCYVTIDVKQNLYTKSDSTDIIEITTNQIRS